MRISRAILTFVAIVTICAGQSFAQNANTRRAQLEKEIAILDQQIKDNAKQSASALTRLSLVRNKVAARKALIQESDNEIASINRQISTKQSSINEIQARLDTMTAYYARLVKGAYKNRDPKVWYMYILASDNLGQGLRRYAFLRDLSKEMNAQAVKIKQVQAELEAEKAGLEKMKAEAQKIRAGRVKELSALQSEEKDAKSITTRLQKEKTRYQKELNEKKRQAQALEREVKTAITKSKKPSVQVDYKLSDKFSANKGKLPWPVQGSITSRFGKQFHPVFKQLQLPPNNGITIAVPKDAEVSCVFDGVVAQISILPGYHQCILVQHGNYFTLYCKIKNVYVKHGDKVKTGQKLGTVDTINGETTFHFEIWNDKTTPQNPEVWLRPR